ncbi:hypothetical protein B0H98_10456 [Vreelandella songnenensis]|uniref:Uncharacterized protein n=1 Tax=Vreelandella songnenensis TaxID=1176243 RepID=A0A2T0V3L2_9GAMM|nr:hypothetical protein B0H98_10456 [Halomonas songnenensis]
MKCLNKVPMYIYLSCVEFGLFEVLRYQKICYLMGAIFHAFVRINSEDTNTFFNAVGYK